ncbi:MAG: hypothetical protein K2O70_08530, partial [Desulfovibrionaceae bacterium]|nr:hypothetical protein [Desulfovibrionaceae bacterium]
MDKEKKRKAPEQQQQQSVLPVPGAFTVNDTNSKSLASLYPAWNEVAPREAVMVGLPATGAAYFSGGNGSGYIDNGMSVFGVSVSGSDEVPLK